MSHRFSGVPNNLLAAILLLFALLVFTLTLVFVRIVVPAGQLTTSFRVAYNIIIAVLATIISSYAGGEIQKQWLRAVNHDISNVEYQLPRQPGVAARWRAILGLNTFPERIRTFRNTGLAQFSFIVTALITAAVVAAVTLTDTTCSSVVNPPRIHSGADNKCMRNLPSNVTERLSPLWEFRTFWNRDDGSAYFATTNLGCPAWSGAQFIGSINTANPEHVAYARNGVGIQRTAIGAPEILYTDIPKPAGVLNRLSGSIESSNLRSVSHCLPVMTTNPVKCRPGGTITYKAGKSQNVPDDQAIFYALSVDAGGCNFTQANSEDPNGPFGIMVSRLCPTWNNVGQGTVAMGATGIISLTLAAAVGDETFLAQNAQKYEGMRNGTIKGVSYAVSCDIDVQPTIKWRTLTLELQQGQLTTTPSYSKLISGVDGCEGNNATNYKLGNGYAGGAVAALVPPLSEGRFWNGMTNAIFNSALNVTDTSDRYSNLASWTNLIRKAPYGFERSTNALEDVLGLTAGITMSQMNTLDSIEPGSPLKDTVEFYPPVSGNATFACTRVGSGNRSALIFTLPPLLAMVIALYLLFAVPRRPTAYKTSRLEDLINIGQATERELNLAYKADHAPKSEDRKTLIGGRSLSSVALPERAAGVGTGTGAGTGRSSAWNNQLGLGPVPRSPTMLQSTHNHNVDKTWL
jgi:hypothetical protein